MDITIQSLVQSPYMRTMAVVPTKSEELVHGIHDHLPPLVKTQLTIPPVRNPGASGRWVFNIPRRGLWHSATLVVRPTILLEVMPSNLDVRQLETVSTFVEAITNIELFSKQRFVERLVPEAIVSEMLKSAGKMEQSYLYSATDLSSAEIYVDAEVPFPHIVNTAALASPDTTVVAARPHYIIPLPLACFSSLKRNFQTLFVEPLSLVVTSNQYKYLVSSGYQMELRCEFHSFHPNVETVIRNANYKQSIPATLPWHDWIVFDNRLNSGDVKKIEYSLESDALISTILVCPQFRHKASGISTMRLNMNLYFVVRSLSEILFEGSVADLKHRYDLTLDESDATQAVEGILDESYAFYFPIHFGLRRDKERFTGGLALSSITNPRITVYPNEFVYRTDSTGGVQGFQFPSNEYYEPFDVKIVAKRHFFLRIDSDTGVISRSIES